MKRTALTIVFGFIATVAVMAQISADSVLFRHEKPFIWRIGVEVQPSFVPGTNGYLKGENYLSKRIDAAFSGALRIDFSFNPTSREAASYRGLYQGLGIDARSFFADRLLGTPVSVYVYQGAPFLRFSRRLWLGYEWQFGAAFGWNHYSHGDNEENVAVSTAVTAHMAAGVKLHYLLSTRWELTLGAVASHFSNGNTSWPNRGVNTLGVAVGVSYAFNHFPAAGASATYNVGPEPELCGWFYDITVYGAWRKRSLVINDEAQLCPGRFAVAGIQVAPMRRFNRWFAAGAALDMQYDESAGLSSYWVEGTFNDNIKFYRTPFGRQLSVGLSAHAEFTMPIFSVNAGIGYDMVSPKGNKRFYQSLTLKTFVTRSLYINTGYRLGDFNEPQNLMLGIGVRL